MVSSSHSPTLVCSNFPALALLRVHEPCLFQFPLKPPPKPGLQQAKAPEAPRACTCRRKERLRPSLTFTCAMAVPRWRRRLKTKLSVPPTSSSSHHMSALIPSKASRSPSLWLCCWPLSPFPCWITVSFFVTQLSLLHPVFWRNFMLAPAWLSLWL
jgi:hypothetical protein